MKKCVNPNCDLGKSGYALFTDGDHYCSNCGKRLLFKGQFECLLCGHHLNENNKFCSGCGRPREEALKKDEEPPRVEPMYGVQIPIPREDPPLAVPKYGVRRK